MNDLGLPALRVPTKDSPAFDTSDLGDEFELAEESPAFVDRANNPQDYPHIKNADGSVSTHRMAAEVDENGNWFAFPTVVSMPGGELKEFGDNREAMSHNLKTGNVKEFGQDKDAALAYAEGGYKPEALTNFNPVDTSDLGDDFELVDDTDFDTSDLGDEWELEKPGAISNMARLAGTSAAHMVGDIAGSTRKMAYHAYGFDWPWLDEVSEDLGAVDLGGERRNTTENIKDEFKEGDVLGTLGAVGKFSAETMVESIPYMISLPLTFVSMSERIADERAANDGREKSDINDLMTAAPFALGSAILERVGAKGITSAGKEAAEEVGKEAIEQGVKYVMKEGGKAALKEGGTELFQEGLIEYVGERWGTDAKMSFAEGAERGAWASLAGGTYGFASGTGVATARSMTADPNQNVPQGTPEEGAMDRDVEGDGNGIDTGPVTFENTAITPADFQPTEGPIDPIAFDPAPEPAPVGLPAPEGIDNRPLIVSPEGEARTQTQQDIDAGNQRNEAFRQEYVDRAASNPEALPAPEGINERPILVDQEGEASRATIQDIEDIAATKQKLSELSETLIEAKKRYVAGVSKDLKETSKTLKEMRKVDIAAPVNESRDELQTMVAKLGGISREDAVAHGIDPAAFKDKVGIRNPFRKNGMTVDEMAESLSQYNLFPEGQYTANELANMLHRSVSGEGVYAPSAGEYVGRIDELIATEGELTRQSEAVSAEVGLEMTSEERIYQAELYQAEKNGASIEDIEAAADALDYNAEDAGAFFDNLSILTRLQNGEFRAEETESKAGSGQSDSAGAEKEPAIPKQETEASGERPPPEITETNTPAAASSEAVSTSESNEPGRTNNELPVSEPLADTGGTEVDPVGAESGQKDEAGVSGGTTEPVVEPKQTKGEQLKAKIKSKRDAIQAKDEESLVDLNKTLDDFAKTPEGVASEKAAKVEREAKWAKDRLEREGIEVTEETAKIFNYKPLDETNPQFKRLSDGGKAETRRIKAEMGEVFKQDPKSEYLNVLQLELEALFRKEFPVADTGGNAVFNEKTGKLYLEPEKPVLNLEAETEQSQQTKGEKLKAKVKAKKEAAQKAEDQAKADTEAKDFRLSGSDRDADVATAGGQESLLNVPSKKEIDTKAHKASTSHKNNLDQPTDAQKEAGNYKKGEPFTLHGQKIVIENPKGSKRSGTDKDGKSWSNTMGAHYGDLKGTIGADGDAIDVFVGARPESEKIFIIDQLQDKGGKGAFDEHKVMMGFLDVDSAKAAYLSSYDKGWKVGPVSELTIEEFKAWSKSNKTTKPYSEKAKYIAEETAVDALKEALDDDKPGANTNPEKSVSDKTTTKGTKLVEKAAENFEDFGEKILGAKKHTVSLRESLSADVDVAALPLSESFPKPDYEKLANAGVDQEVLFFVAYLRKQIPAKPRKYGKKGWADKVELMRHFSNDLLEGNISKEKLLTSLGQNTNLGSLSDVVPLAKSILSSQIDDLASYSLAKQHFVIFEGKKNVNKWVATNHRGSSGYGGMENQAHFDTKDEALAFIKSQVTTTSDKGKPLVKFDMWSERGKKGVFVGKKVGPRKYIELAHFDTSKEAKDHVNTHNEELVEQLKQKKKVGSHRRAEQNERVGIDYRNGKNVTSDLFAETFGFRGVQFGNYVENDRRQQDLNNAYDGLLDLAGVLNIPPAAISLNGELGLAFGARGIGGKGSPSAHYESGDVVGQDNVVINLTKKNGPGALAHEWWHALDNYFARMGELKAKDERSYITELNRPKRKYVMQDGYQKAVDVDPKDFGVRPEVYDAFKDLVVDINAKTDLVKRSGRLDTRRTKDYYGLERELTARSFERYVIDKLAKDGYESDYLATVLPKEAWDAAEVAFGNLDESYPYPTDDEAKITNAAYQKIFDELKTKKTDSGIALFRDAGEGGSVSILDANEVVGRIKADWSPASADRVQVVSTFSDLDKDVQQASNESGGNENVRGIFHKNKLYLIAENHTSQKDVEETLFHEAYGHLGLKGLFGKDIHKQMNQLYLAIGGSKGLNTLAKKHGINLTKYAQRLSAMQSEGKITADIRNAFMMQELLAHMAEDQRPSVARKAKEVLGKIRQWLREHGYKILGKVSDSELFYLLKKSREAVIDGNVDGSFYIDEKAMFRSEEDAVDSTGFAIPDEQLSDVAIRKIQDKFKVLKDVVSNLKESGGKVDDSNNAYIAEELFHGKAENDLRVMSDEFIKPLADVMAKHNIQRTELDEYLIAKHAEERNAQIASINPKFPDGGSGMTNAEAQQVIQKVSKMGKRSKYDEAAQIVYDMLKARRDAIKDSGLEADSMIDSWESTYQFYVPLKGIDEGGNKLPRTGKGYNIGGRESKRAMGRQSEAESPVSHAISDMTETLIRKRKNEVGNALLQLIEDNPQSDYWEVFTDENPEFDRRIVKKAGGEEVVEQPVPMAMFADNYFTAKRDGKTHYMKLHDERLMKAMKNLGPESNTTLIRTLSAITRIMSSLNTSLNPEFIISNFARDIQTAVLNLQAEQSRDDGKAKGTKIAKQTVKDVPRAMKAIYDSLRGLESKNEKTREWQKHFDEFRAAGGKTGWFDMKDIDGQAANLDTLISQDKGGIKGAAHKTYHYTAEFVENVNSTIENAVRLSAYVNAKRAGISTTMAASLSKNMTVNFNRKGELGTTMNALFMFANASTQGVANFVRTMYGLNKEGGNTWSRMNNAQKAAVGIMAGAYTMSVANRMMAGDDDDGVNWYDKVPDYVKERNFVIMKSLYGGKPGEYWKIPLPYGYNVFSVMGLGFESITAGGVKNIPREASNIVLATLGSFSPIGFQDSESVHGMLLKNAAPTVIKPFVEVALNENFMASSIYNKNFPFGTKKPDSSLGRRSTPTGYVALTKFLNDATGGSDYRSGAIDVNPDVLQHFVEFYGGGAYRMFGTKVPDTIEKISKGVEVEAYRIPFAGKVTGKVLHYQDISDFYDRRNEIGQVNEEYKHLTGQERVNFRKEHDGILKLRGRLKFTENRMSRLRKRKKRIYADKSLTAKAKDLKLREVEKKIKSAVDGFNRRYNEADK